MNDVEATPWFPVSTPPIRRGWYDVTGFLLGIARFYWDGRRWYRQDEPPNGSRRGRAFVVVAVSPTDQWRGRARP